MLFFLSCTFPWTNGEKNCCLYVAQWSSKLKKDKFDEGYCRGPAKHAFSGLRTVENASSMMYLVGMLEHENNKSGTRRTYFLDPQQRALHLLERGKTSADGVDRVLADVVE